MMIHVVTCDEVVLLKFLVNFNVYPWLCTNFFHFFANESCAIYFYVHTAVSLLFRCKIARLEARVYTGAKTDDFDG